MYEYLRYDPIHEIRVLWDTWWENEEEGKILETMKISFFFTQPKGEYIFINKIIDFSSFFLLLAISQFFFFASLNELK